MTDAASRKLNMRLGIVSKERKSVMTKRAFINKILMLISGLLSIAAAWGIGRFARLGFAASRRREFSKELLSRLEYGVPKHVADAGVWIIRTEDSQSVTVLDDKCPHLGCKPNWNPARMVFECPCHGSEFDIKGSLRKGPATRRMTELYLEEGNATTVVVSDRPSSRQ